MVDNLGSTYRELFSNHLYWILAALGILIGSSFVGILFGPQIQESIFPNLFSSLITVVGSVLAIGFSVLFISAQIASERYSPKFTVRFVNDPIVKISFGMGILCIIFDIMVLGMSSGIYSTLKLDQSNALRTLYWITGGLIVGLNIVFLGLLYPFIRLILIQTMPTNILSQFRRRYSAKEYRIRAKDAEDTITKHPMQPVYDLARNSIIQEDYISAISACETLLAVPKEYLLEIENEFDKDSDLIIVPVLEKYMIPLFMKADEKSQLDLVKTLCKGWEDIGEEAIRLELYDLHRFCFNKVHSDLFLKNKDQLKPGSVEYLSKCGSELFKQMSSDTERFREYIPAFSKFIGDFKNESISYLHISNSISRCYIDIILEDRFEKDQIEIEIIKVLIGDSNQLSPWEQPDGDSPSSILGCTYLLMQTTSAIFHHLKSEPLPGFIIEDWQECVSQDHPPELEKQHIHILRRYIELCCIIDETQDSGLSASNRVVELAKSNGIEEKTIQACDSILTESRPDSELADLRFLEISLPTLWDPILLTDYQESTRDLVNKIKDKLS